MFIKRRESTRKIEIDGDLSCSLFTFFDSNNSFSFYYFHLFGFTTQ